ncbi:MAG: hypothetical protein IJ877_03425 [Candidatus Gastranaerophilales bacterium]|nr:hypothetical protein [Candidatus Gastranaerophilales bacterium]
MSTKQKHLRQSGPAQKHKSTLSKTFALAISVLVLGGILYKNKINKKIITPNDKYANIPETFLNVEHINFKEGATIEEAMKFGYEKLGIIEYKGFDAKDIDVINWVNEGIVNVYNKSKGKAVIPYIIQYEAFAQKEESIVLANINSYGSTMKINKNFVEELKEHVANRIMLIKERLPNKKYQEMIDDFEKGKNNLKYHFDFAKDVSTSRFETIYHEMGHYQHYINAGAQMYNDLANPGKIKDEAEYSKIIKLIELFHKTDTAAKVSEYASTSPLEFVAEVYAKLCEGIELSDKILDLYKKLGGVLI